MTFEQNEIEEKAAQELRRRKKMMSYSFWGTIILLAIATVGLSLIGSFRSATLTEDDSSIAIVETAPAPVELPQTTIERIVTEAAGKAYVLVAPSVNELLENVYQPVYAAIPVYASYHYSVFGEYIELSEAVRGEMSAGIYERLYDGFETRLSDTATLLDLNYSEEFQNALQAEIEVELPEGSLPVPLGPLTQTAKSDALRRASVTVPLAAVAATLVGSGALATVTSAIAAKLAAKIGVKAAAKVAAKGGGVLAGAGGGALICSWSGPGAIACGAIGGLVAWFVTDAVVVNIDEYFNRDDFEAELRLLIDEDRAAMTLLLENTLQDKALEMGANPEYFTLLELGKNDESDDDPSQ